MFYGYNVLREVLDQWFTNNTRAEDSITVGLAGQLRSSFEDLFQKRLLKPIYLTCFCEEDNLLSQWRTYGQSGGYSIGVRMLPKIGIFGERLIPEPSIYTCRWIKVEYERTKQLEICRNILNPIFTSLDQPGTTEAMREVSEHPFVGYQRLLTPRWTFFWNRSSDSRVRRSTSKKNGVLLFDSENFTGKGLMTVAKHLYQFTFGFRVECWFLM